jgi:Flp pilus assembly protein TadD
MLLVFSACTFSSQDELPYDMTLTNEGYQEMLDQNYEKAEAFFDLALSVNPENPYALLNLGVVYHNTGRIEQAKQMYRKVIDLKPTLKAKNSTNNDFKGKTLSEIAKKNLRAIEK